MLSSRAAGRPTFSSRCSRPYRCRPDALVDAARRQARVLTRRGWGICLSSGGFAIAGRILSIPELYAVAVAALALAGGAIAYVRFWPWQVDAQREVHPPQVHADGSSRVELSVRNLDERPSPVLSARDP